MSDFAAPGTSSGIDWADHLGALLLIDVKSHERDITTSLGTKDAISCSVTVVEGAGAPADYEDALVFPKVLIGQLKGRIGRKVLGRLTQGEAKPGQNPPWKLTDATDADVKTATEYLTATAAKLNDAPF